MDKDTSVKVAVRIRPLSSDEAIHEPLLCLGTIPEGSQVPHFPYYFKTLLTFKIILQFTFRSLLEMILFSHLITCLVWKHNNLKYTTNASQIWWMVRCIFMHSFSFITLTIFLLFYLPTAFFEGFNATILAYGQTGEYTCDIPLWENYSLISHFFPFFLF